uniref:Uncharacterized protein n=1 Tax=Arundo donax TaxID=35708 RepID=A0A0A8ZZ85_ARUDO
MLLYLWTIIGVFSDLICEVYTNLRKSLMRYTSILLWKHVGTQRFTQSEENLKLELKKILTGVYSILLKY